jgi:S1-C subfamily serine protease
VVLAVVVLGAALGLAAWWGTGADAPSGQPVASVAGAVLDRDAPSPEVQAALRRSVRLVHAEGCGVERQATVTVLDRGGRTVGLTNQHVVAGADEVSVDGVPGLVPVTGPVIDRDAAELEGDPLLDGGGIALKTGHRPSNGASVVVAGYPDGHFVAATGTVRSIEQRQGYGATTDVIVIDTQAVPGISGGVVLDVTGAAIGLVAARDPVTGDVVAYPLDVIGPASDSGRVSCSGSGR